MSSARILTGEEVKRTTRIPPRFQAPARHGTMQHCAGKRNDSHPDATGSNPVRTLSSRALTTQHCIRRKGYSRRAKPLRSFKYCDDVDFILHRMSSRWLFSVVLSTLHDTGMQIRHRTPFFCRWIAALTKKAVQLSPHLT